MCTITVRQLIDAGACRDAKIRFRELFGDRVEVTEDAALAVADDIDWDWAADHFLSVHARAEYERVKAADHDEYGRVVALREYRRMEEDAWAKYERMRAAAWAKYRRVAAAARAEYERVKARTFARLYLG